MKIHEYQAKALMAEVGIPVPRGDVASTPQEARQIAEELGGRVVVKAQVYAGGRGKAGGIKMANSSAEAEKAASELIGNRLVTYQTTTEGVPIDRVLVEQALPVKREVYVGIVLDSSKRMPVVMATGSGGMDIEEVARTSPEKIVKVHIDPAIGFRSFYGRHIAYSLGFNAAQLKPLTTLINSLYRLYKCKDCSLAEINPLVVTESDDLVALDAKINFDDNALFRHKTIRQFNDVAQEDPLEVKARELGINNYIRMDGNIGCMVNGAGLAMAVMDAINHAGGKPANFLDIGTVNNPQRVINSFRIFSEDSRVKAVLINIFGGMARADIIANGIVEAFRQVKVRVPVVVRLAGTNVKAGKRILAESGLPIIEATDFFDAAGKAVAAARGGAR